MRVAGPTADLVRARGDEFEARTAGAGDLRPLLYLVGFSHRHDVRLRQVCNGWIEWLSNCGGTFSSPQFDDFSTGDLFVGNIQGDDVLAALSQGTIWLDGTLAVNMDAASASEHGGVHLVIPV